jgi:hypothetical protein
MNLRCKPGDLAVVIDARLPSNLVGYITMFHELGDERQKIQT